MERLNSIITTYQQKICKHDRQIWEQPYETDLFKLKNIPRKAAKINTSLIDVDLFRGSAFSVSKSQSGWLSIVTLAWFRLIFFPFCFRWWLHSTCSCVFVLLCMLYSFQLCSLVVLYLNFQQLHSIETLTMADFVTPYVMMYVLTVVHSLITANYNFPARHSTHPSNGKRSKASVVQSYQSHVSENLRKSDQLTGKKCKEDSAMSLQSQRKENVLTGVSSTSLACSEVSAKMFDAVSEVHVSRESLNCTLPSADDFLLPRSSKFRTCESCQNSQSQNENLGMSSGSEFYDAQPRSADHLALIGRVDSCQSEDSKTGNEASSPVQLSPSMTEESLLTVVESSYEELATALEYKCRADAAPETQDNRCTLENVPETFAAKVQALSLTKSRFTDQEKISESVDTVHRASNSQTDDEGSHGVLSSLETNYEDRSPEVVSVADSNTSMSDTCNSSFVSSADDDDNHVEKPTGGCATAARNFSTVRDKKFKKLDAEYVTTIQFGVRHRRKPAHNQNQSPVKRSPLRTFESIHASRNESTDVCSHAEKRNRVASESAESDEEEEDSKLKHGVKLRGSFLRQPMTRKPCISCKRNSETDSADEIPAADPSLSLDAHESPQFGVRSGMRDPNGCEKRSRSLPFVKHVQHQDSDEVLDDTQLPFHRTSGQSGSEKSLHTLNNTAGSMTEPLPAGFLPSSLINCITSTTDKVSCMIWSTGGAVHKVDLTILDIGWTIVRTVDSQQERCDYMMLGILLSFVITFMPSVYRLYQHPDHEGQASNCTYVNATMTNYPSYASLIFGSDVRQVLVLANGMIQRLFLSLLFFFLLSVAERTFKQKLLYAKYFCYLTSSRKAKKYDLPHFRLNKVRNIKTWLSLRSFLKKRGPQRSVESVVSSSFILAVILVSILCIELLQDYGHFLEHLGNWELVLWGMILGVYLLRFMTLGTKINKKYRNLSVLITEQINLYLHMEQKPHKKAALMVANNVLKLAEGLVKELESPFKISGLSANPFLYNITKVVILSAFSAVLTELLGFKLKLYKIKLRS